MLKNILLALTLMISLPAYSVDSVDNTQSISQEADQVQTTEIKEVITNICIFSANILIFAVVARQLYRTNSGKQSFINALNKPVDREMFADNRAAMKTLDEEIRTPGFTNRMRQGISQSNKTMGNLSVILLLNASFIYKSASNLLEIYFNNGAK